MKPLTVSRRASARLAGSLSALGLAAGLLTPSAAAAEIQVSIRNLAPDSGVYLTPFWAGFHNGSFDLFNPGSPASAALKRLAEDGDASMLGTSLTGSGHGSTHGVIPSTGLIPPFAPGDTGSMTFTLDPFEAMNRFLSFASMVIPSNDAFIGNGDPMTIEVFDGAGMFVGGTFTIFGSMVWDAGTEVNDEIPANTAFFGQTTPNTGTEEGGNVMAHAGFMAAGMGGILDDPRFANADFTSGNYPLAEITVSVVPEPQTYAVLAALGLLGFAGWRRSRLQQR